jgi:hypothetical protein
MHRPSWWKHYVVMSVKGYKFKVSSVSFAVALVTDVDCSLTLFFHEHVVFYNLHYYLSL